MGVMTLDDTVLYSFGLYVLYVLLPIIPAVVIFLLFPDTKVWVSGPLQNLTIKTTGAFAAYVVTVSLGFFPVRYVETQIAQSRSYAIEGVIEVEPNQYVDSDRFYSRYVSDADADSHFPIRHYHFVLLLNHPLDEPEKVWIKYWELNASGGTGAPPSPTDVAMELTPRGSFPERFRLRKQNDQLKVELEP
jgi:hypothetical protein